MTFRWPMVSAGILALLTNMRCLLNDVKCVMEGRTAESRGNCSQ